jgi:hypothetical protein
MTTLVHRHFFSITDVVSALLPDGPVDCERFEFRVNGGMLELDVVGQVYPQGMPSAFVVDEYIPESEISGIAARAIIPDEIGFPDDQSPPWDEAETEDVPAADMLKGGPLAKKAGILCAKPAFWTFLKVRTQEAATNVLRRECGVKSRAELDHNSEAAAAFDRLWGEFLLWDSPQ